MNNDAKLFLLILCCTIIIVVLGYYIFIHKGEDKVSQDKKEDVASETQKKEEEKDKEDKEEKKEDMTKIIADVQKILSELDIKLEPEEIYAIYYCTQYLKDKDTKIEEIIKKKYKEKDDSSKKVAEVIMNRIKDINCIFDRVTSFSEEKQATNAKNIRTFFNINEDLEKSLKNLLTYKTDKDRPISLEEEIRKQYPEQSQYFDYKGKKGGDITFIENFITQITEK